MDKFSENQLRIFFSTYQTLQKMLQKYTLEQIRSDQFLELAFERILSLLAITVSRIYKHNRHLQIPYIKTVIRLKNQLVWDLTPLKLSYVKNLINLIIPSVANYFSNLNPSKNEKNFSAASDS